MKRRTAALARLRPAAHPCADILAIVNLQNGGFDITNPNNVFITQHLNNYNGEDYTINLFITGLILLKTSECASVKASSGLTIPANQCIGFISQENNVNDFQASLQIRTMARPKFRNPPRSRCSARACSAWVA